MQFRAATPADAEAIARLHATSWRTAYRGALTDAYLDGPIEAERIAVWRGRFERPDPSQFIVVAEEDGRMVGFVCAYGGQDEQWGTFVDNLHVIPGYKGLGIGAQLMREVAQWSQAHHPGQGVYLWVLESNAPARAFYARIGGEEAGRDVWSPPDGTPLPKLRIAWRTLDTLLRRRS